MAERSYTVRVGIDASDVVSGARQAENAVSGLSGSITDQFERNADSIQKVGTAFLAVGAATIAGLGLAAKAAIDWESAWTGVLKTVDGTPEQLGQIEDGLRGLARELPTSHREIAAVAEAAGQLGVQSDAVLGFTRVMIDLGETTNLTAEGAATAIAQIGNVMGTDLANDVDNFGSALVDLGNKGASTEKEILDMAQRIAGAGAQIGLTEADVLGLASSLASVGIEAAAGGTAISRVMIDMSTAVANGGNDLKQFADVAGVSADQFATAFREDPAQAIVAFIEGLDRISSSGGNVFETLENLGLSEIRVRDALLRLANAGNLTAQSILNSNTAWERNNALAEEAGKRYDTTAAKIEIAKNNIVDAGISLGETLLPALETVAVGVADLAGWFADLPAPIQSAAAGLGGIVGVAALVAGGFLLLFPRVIQTVSAFRTLSQTAPGVTSALRRIGRAATVATALSLVATAIGAIAESGESGAKGVEATTRALLNLKDATSEAEGMEHLNSLFEELDNNLVIGGQGVDDFGGALDRIFSPSNLQRYNDFSNATLNVLTLGGWGQGESTELQNAKEQIDNMDAALANLVSSGNGEEATEIWKQLTEQAESQGVSLEELQKLFPQYAEALAGVENEQRKASGSGSDLTAVLEEQAAAAGMTTEEFEAAQDAFTGLVEEQAAQLASAVDPLGAWEAATQRAAESAAEAAGKGKESWQDFADSAEVSLSDFIAELEKQVQAQEDWATNMAILAGRVTEDVFNELMRWGPEGAPLVAEMVNATDEEMDKLNELLPESLATTQEAMTTEMQKWRDVAQPIAQKFGQDVADKIAAGIADGSTSLDAELEKLNLKITEISPGEYVLEADIDAEDFFLKGDAMSQDIKNLNEDKVEPDADLNIKQYKGQEGILRESMNQLNQSTPTPKADLNTTRFDAGVTKTTGELNKLDGKKPTPDANMNLSPFEARKRDADRLLSQLNGRRAEPDADLNYSPLSRGVGRAQGRVNSLRGKTVSAHAEASGISGVFAIINAIAAMYSKTVTATVVTKRVGALPKADGGWINGYAGGGSIIDLQAGGHNPYGTTSRADDVLALVSKDEFVVRAMYAKRNRRLLELINSGATIPGFANGGGIDIARSIARGPIRHTVTVPPAPVVLDSSMAGGLGDGDRQLLLDAINRPIVLTTVDRTVIAREAEAGKQVLARRQ